MVDLSKYVPSEVELKLRIAIFRLLDRKYRAQFQDQTKFLCAGILNWAFLESPGNEEALRFWQTNEQSIIQEAKNLYIDSNIAMSLSVLYALTLILLGPKNPDKTFNLAERATEMNIVIYSAKELYPTDDAIQFLEFIDLYADRLLKI